MNTIYKTGKVYMIYNDIMPETYIGSTTASLKRRFQKHKNASATFCDRKIYKLFNKSNWSMCHIVLLENVKFYDRKELIKRERFFIDLLKPTLNCVVPFRTRKEYRTDNQNSIRIKKKEYYDNISSIKYECDCGRHIQKGKKKRHVLTKYHQNQILKKLKNQPITI
tara:strand:+ start:4032 stop:4529 length:498 start_codon:yes stop_codon:yes gene_type:complete